MIYSNMKSTIYAWRGSKVLAVVAVGVMCLSSCQSEKADEPVANEPEAVVKPEGYAVFASKSYDTHTSMDEYGSFYWSVGDRTAIKNYTQDGKTRRHAYALEINNRNTNPFVRLKYKDEDWELVMRRWGFIAGYRPYTDNESWFQ